MYVKKKDFFHLLFPLSITPFVYNPFYHFNSPLILKVFFKKKSLNKFDTSCIKN